MQNYSETQEHMILLNHRIVTTHSEMSLEEMNWNLKSFRELAKMDEDYKTKMVLLVDEKEAGDFYAHIRNLFIIGNDLIDKIGWVVITKDPSKTRMLNEEKAHEEFLTRHVKTFFPKAAVVVR